MKITYIAHSSFLVETKTKYLLFDYVQGALPAMDKAKPLYVFVSHAHQDHYSEAIFHLSKTPVVWILSDDIHTAHAHVGVKANQTYEIKDLHIVTLMSTDAGVAFIIKTDDACIYHAGDLNWWDWGEEDTPQEEEEMKQRYLQEMKKLERYHFDVAFLVIDPRLKERACKGAEAFLKHASCDVLVPMHFWKDDSIFAQIRKEDWTSRYFIQVWLDFKELETFTKV